MAETIETEYRGHKITYSENSDEWRCWDIEYSNISMQKVKAKIDAFYLKLRKESAVPCYELSSYGVPSKTESTIIEFVKTVEQRAWATNKLTKLEHKVAVVARRSGNDRASRRETEINSLMPETPEALAAFSKAEHLYADVKKATDAFNEAFAAIPRIKLEDVSELKRIKEAQTE